MFTYSVEPPAVAVKAVMAVGALIARPVVIAVERRRAVLRQIAGHSDRNTHSTLPTPPRCQSLVFHFLQQNEQL